MRNYCAFENRKSAVVGAKLLALSLEKHCRDFTLFLGVIDDDPQFYDWLRRHAPHVVVVRLPPFIQGSSLKHIKPLLILKLFNRGITDVTWLDTDLLVLRDLEPLLAPLDEKTLLVAQDMDYVFQFNERLADHYHLAPSRKLPHCVNTCVLRVTTRHMALMKKFHDSLLDPAFVAEQEKPEMERRPDFAFDQRILELLLSSRSDDWNPDCEIKFVPEGSGIIQELGVTTYGLRDRLLNGLGIHKPWFAHVPGSIKPWAHDHQSRHYRGASVYSSFAEVYKDKMEDDMSWPNSSGATSWIGRWLFFGIPHWMGWAHCLAGKIRRFFLTGTIRRKA